MSSAVNEPSEDGATGELEAAGAMHQDNKFPGIVIVVFIVLWMKSVSSETHMHHT